MRRRLFIELLVLSALVATWYHLLPEEPRFAKCVFAKAEAKILSECEGSSLLVDSLKAQGAGARALELTQQMLILFESELRTFEETSPFAKNCESQDNFLWVSLSSIEASQGNLQLKQAYVSFPGSSMSGEALDRKIPLIDGGAAADRNLEVGTEGLRPRSHRIYIPRLKNCSGFEFQVALDLMDLSEGDPRLYSLSPTRFQIAFNDIHEDHFELHTGGLKMRFRVERKEISNLSQAETSHQTYSYDNKLLLIKDLFNRSMATRLDYHHLVNLNSAFIIDFHNKVLPLFTKGSPEVWIQAVSDFNFTLDSGLLQGAFFRSVSDYYIN